jgi:CHAT domain-containing protein
VTILLEYALGLDRSFLWVVQATSMHSFELPGRRHLEDSARRLYELARVREERNAKVQQADLEFARAAAELGGALLGPATGLLGKKRLVIVASGVLEYVPFAALPCPSGPGAGQPLVVEHEIVRLPSVSVLAALRRGAAGRSPSAKTLMILADPVFANHDSRLLQDQELVQDLQVDSAVAAVVEDDPEPRFRNQGPSLIQTGGFQRLHYSRREAEAIAALLDPSQVTLALDLAASRGLVASGELSRHRILHFATHGLLNSKHPELSALVLSMVDPNGQPADGLLRLHDIYGLELKADLVVLSACQTALGREIQGEGLIGLTRGFMYAGGTRVLASLWTVQDKATKELMTRFYRLLLKEGEPPAAALRAAQISMLGERRFAAPYYWAAFVLQGDWR